MTSKIITTEKIDSTYNDVTQQMRIKQCIKDAWQNHGTKYVLLGGDTNIIPVQYCKMYNDRYVITEQEKNYYTIPADIYYVCFSQIDWDTNNDGFAGDFWKDDINVFPYIDISRLPIQTETDCQTVVNRIIEYEQNPRINRRFFQAGIKMSSNISGQQMGDVFFNNVFNNKVSIERDTLFTNSYIEQNFINNFSQKFAAGPAFAQLICHGVLTAWADKYFTFFTGENAESFCNPNHTFVSTISCLTNAYDDVFGDKCLSEILLRNPNSGIIGYLGSSRYGWFSSSKMTLSMGYEKEFYERLFDPDRQNSPGISFGTLVTEVKRSFRSLAESSETYRQLQYAINPIGDPEMPIFTEYPSEFSTATANIDTFDRLTVITGEDNARVCVSNRSLPENSDATGGYYQVGYGNELVFENVPTLCDVWITKQNFIPKHFSLISPSAIVNPNEPSTKTELVLVMLNSATSQMTVRFTRNSQNSTIKLGVIPISGGNSYLFPVTNAFLVDENLYETNIDLWGVPKGAYIVKLYEDSIVAEKTFKIIKQ